MLEISKANALRGEITLPGDKSISHRALILGSIANGTTTLTNFPFSLDCLSTVSCLRTLGTRITLKEPGEAKVCGSSGKGFCPAQGVLFAGNSATTLRLLAGMLSGEKGTCTLDGDASLRRRPMKRIIEPLSRMGADIRARKGEFAPLTITGTKLDGIRYELPVPSAQVKSAILLAGLRASGQTSVREPAPTRDHTERMLRAMGASISEEDGWIVLEEGAQLEGTDVAAPGDFSSAAFFVVAAATVPGSEVLFRRVGLNPRRTGLITVLRKMGADIEIELEEGDTSEPVGSMYVRTSTLRGTVVEGKVVASLIDEIPILALAATQAEGETLIRGAGELRRKETDRIKATVFALRTLGAQIEELEDGLAIRGPRVLTGARVVSESDHRIAMMSAIAGLIAHGRTEVVDSQCIDVSFPGFISTLRGLVA